MDIEGRVKIAMSNADNLDSVKDLASKKRSDSSFNTSNLKVVLFLK
jgi:hypothetical protein